MDKKRKYIRKSINESVVSPADSVAVDYLDYKLFELRLELVSRVSKYEKLENEISLYNGEIDRLEDRRYDAVQRAEREFRDSSRDYT